MQFKIRTVNLGIESGIIYSTSSTVDMDVLKGSDGRVRNFLIFSKKEYQGQAEPGTWEDT